MPTPIRYPGGYRVNTWVDGRKVLRVFTGVDALKQAREFCQTLESKSLNLTKKTPILDAIRDYHRWSEFVKHKGRSQMVQQGHTLEIFRQFSREAGIRTVNDIDKEAARNFMAWYFEHYPFHLTEKRKERKSDGTATWEQYRQVLHAFCSWLIRREVIRPTNPFADAELKIKRQQKMPRILTGAEVTKLLAFWDSRSERDPIKLHIFFRFLLYTGCRLNEARSLKFADIAGGLVRVTKSKTKTVRTIPIAAALKPWLAQLKGRHDDSVFPEWDQARYWKELRRATDALDIPNCRVHDFRHTFAANLAMNGVQIVAIQKLLGHSDIRMTMVYTHFHPEHLQTAVDSLKF